MRRKAGNAVVGIEIRTDGIALAKVTKQSDESVLQYHNFRPCNAAERAETLSQLVAEAQCNNARCHLVLPTSNYQTFQVEKPAVEEAEMAEAVRWKLNDLIDYPIDDAVSDVFEFPSDAGRSRGKMINVVSARKVVLSDQIKLIQDAGLELHCIDITELALRNICNFFVVDEQTLGFMYLRPGFGIIIFVKGDHLYLSRKIDVNEAALNSPDTQEAALGQLSLEIQRSMDFFESQLGQIPPKRLLLIGPDVSLPLAQMLDPLLGVAVDDANWDEVLEEQDGENLSRLVMTLPAVGAAYRELRGE
ncbi:MAG: biogenesis protein MshI [Pseudomonadales bacterium]|nr:biogenesis protein MshI [Pseudomonadales bacterium]